MHISYQGVPGAYSSIAAAKVNELLQTGNPTQGLAEFNNVRDDIAAGNVGILPIENSYAGSIHANFYYFIRNNAKVIGEIALPIEHALLSKETNLTDIKKAYSHPQALAQCHNFLNKHNIKAMEYPDTAGAAQMLASSDESGAAAIASEPCGEIYGLNVIQTKIQDQEKNTTRFLIVVKQDSDVKYPSPSSKTSIIFETKDMPGALYKCLGAFANNNINLTKIESLPSYKNPFDYIFWIDIQGHLDTPEAQRAIDELKLYTVEIQVLGEY